MDSHNLLIMYSSSRQELDSDEGAKMNLAIAIISIVLVALIAWWKGYSSSLWAAAAGPLGLIVLIFALPDLGKYPEKKENLRKRGNSIGATLSILSLFVVALYAIPRMAEEAGFLNISFLVLILLTGIFSVGVSREFFTFKSNLTETIGCFFIFPSIVIIIFIIAFFASALFHAIFQQ